jgi:hypothetical protein
MAREPGDAPGLEWIKRARDGARIPRWRARKSAVALGYRPSFIRLYIDPNDYAAIAERCRVEWAKMEAWLANEQSVPRFDGTIESLIDIYASDENSPYQDLKYRTQVNYDKDLRLLKKTVGERRVDKLTGDDFRHWYRKWREPKPPGSPPRISRAHSLITRLPILFGYGQTKGYPNCETLKNVLAEMRFKATPPREVVITYQQVVAFIAKAHELNEPELALAQALQFEGTLRQIDVIGEWLPDPERPSGFRWANGLLWQHLRDYVLIKKTTKTGQEAGIDFKLYPLALAELRRVPPDKRVGPVIIDRLTEQPFKSSTYRRRWRAVARAAGIPDDVMSRDSHAGGVTEGSDAGADLEHLRHHASHRNPATTARYSRTTLTKTRAVARLRVAHRKAGNEENDA